MILDKRTTPPAFIVDAIPGAPELREEVATALAAFSEAGAAQRRAGELLREKTRGPLGELTPREGVSHAEATAVEDSYRHAVEAQDAADRAHKRALARLHSKVQEGMQTDAFKDSHERLADEAHAVAVAAASALRKALADRDGFDAAIGRRRDPSAAAPYDRRYYLEGVDKLVNARVMTDRERAIDVLESSTMTSAERIAFVKRNGLVPA